jgi:pyrroloquinoline quinone (PQQ) biosynthesis protein C
MRITELERELAPLREEYRGIVNPWLESGLFGVTYPALLVETYHYVKHSTSLMSHACARLLPEDTVLQRYLAHHIAEEVSHEQWVLDDLETLGYSRDAVCRSLPLPETLNLVGSQLYVIEYLDPRALIGYIYVMESMPPGERLFEYLEAAGIPKKAMTFLVRHGEADIVHRRELEAIIEEHFHDAHAREALELSATQGLSNVNRLLERIRSGQFTLSRPLIRNYPYSTPDTLTLKGLHYGS